MHFDRNVPHHLTTIVVPCTALLHPVYEYNNQTRGGLGRVCSTGIYRSIGNFRNFNRNFLLNVKPPKSLHSTNTSSRGQYLSREFTCMPMARLQQLFYQMLHVFSIKNNRATISSSSFTTAPREGLTLRANGISLDFSGNLRFKKKIGWYVS